MILLYSFGGSIFEGLQMHRCLNGRLPVKKASYNSEALLYTFNFIMIVETSLLSQITTQNILSFTLTQTTLENNFQLILQALRKHQSSIALHATQHHSLEKQLTQHLAQIDNSSKASTSNANQIAGLNAKMSELSALVSKFDNQKANRSELNSLMKGMKEAVHPQSLSETKNESKQLSGVVRKLQSRLNDLSKSHEKCFNEIFRQNDSTIRRLQEQTKQNADKLAQLEALFANTTASHTQQYSQLQSALQKSSQELHRQIKLQKEHVSNIFEETRHQINKNNEKIAQNDRSIGQINKSLKKIIDDIWKITDQLYKPDVQSTIQIENFQHKIDKLEDMIHEHLKHNSALTRNTDEESPLKEAAIRTMYVNNKDAFNTKDLSEQDSDFRREMMEKLKQYRLDMSKAIKKIEGISMKKDEDKYRLDKLQQKGLKLEHALNSYVDSDNFKKWVKFIENKINYLYRVINLENNEEDACIARKNWICLSCDKKLDSYKGKLGSHLNIAQLKSKGIEHDIIGGGMLFKNKSRIEMSNSLKK